MVFSPDAYSMNILDRSCFNLFYAHLIGMTCDLSIFFPRDGHMACDVKKGCTKFIVGLRWPYLGVVGMLTFLISCTRIQA